MSNNEYVQAQEKGSKLGFLIASLKVSNKAKEALLSLLDQMTEDQIDRLVNILEANFLNAVTQDSDQELGKKLKELGEIFFNKIDEINKDTEQAADIY